MYVGTISSYLLYKTKFQGFFLIWWWIDLTSVTDPDPYVFRPPGSELGSVSQMYGSRSGSFYHQAKIVRKTLILTVLWFPYDFLSLKNCTCEFEGRIQERIQPRSCTQNEKRLQCCPTNDMRKLKNLPETNKKPPAYVVQVPTVHLRVTYRTWHLHYISCTITTLY